MTTINPYERVVIPEALTLIRGAEKVALKPYQGGADRKGVLTVGIGHKIRTGEEHLLSGVTPKQAEDLFKADVAKHSVHIQEDSKAPERLDDYVYGALASFAFNLGPRILLTAPSITNHFAKGEIAAGVLNMYKFSRADDKYQDGLFYRRLQEMALALEHKLIPKPENCEGAKTVILDLSAYGDCIEMESYFNSHHVKEHCHVCCHHASAPAVPKPAAKPKPAAGKPAAQSKRK